MGCNHEHEGYEGEVITTLCRELMDGYLGTGWFKEHEGVMGFPKTPFC